MPHSLIVVDGTNVCRLHKPSPLLSGLLIILSDFQISGRKYICLFDANTRYKLSDADRGRYEELICYEEQFGEVPGRRQADEYILHIADRENGIIVSNDHFRDYAHKYPWLRTERHRLAPAMIVAGRILVNDLGIDSGFWPANHPSYNGLSDILVKRLVAPRALKSDL